MSALALAQPAALDVTVVEPTALPADLSAQQARALTDGLRTDLAAVVVGLARAFVGRAWIALGHDSWQTYLRVELGDVFTGLDKIIRRDVVGALADLGMSNYAIAAALGSSDGTVRGDLKVVRPDGRTGPRIGADGKTYAARTAEHLTGPRPMLAIAGPKKQDTALELLAAAGVDGLTVPELMKAKRWSWSQASACLSRLNRAGRAVERLAERRNGHAVYVLPAHVDGRVVLEPGQRIARTA